MNKYKAPALAKGLDIIDLIRESGQLSFNEIQDKTGDNPASLSRYLHTLIAKNYIHKTHCQKYTLGHKLMELSDTKGLWPSINTMIKPLMTQINQDYNVTVLLLAYATNSYIAIDKVIAPDNIGMMSQKSVGKNTIDSLWTNKFYRKNLNLEHEMIMDGIDTLADSYKSLITFVGQNDYMENSSLESHIIRLGLPIRHNDYVIATLGIGSYLTQLNDSDKEAIIQLAKSTIQTIEKQL